MAITDGGPGGDLRPEQGDLARVYQVLLPPPADVNATEGTALRAPLSGNYVDLPQYTGDVAATPFPNAGGLRIQAQTDGLHVLGNIGAGNVDVGPLIDASGIPSGLKTTTYLTPCAGGIADSAAGTRTLTSASSFCVYIGRASGAASAVTIYYDLTGAFTLGAGKLGICKGLPPDAGAGSLTYLGHAVLSGADFGLGAKKKAVTLTTNIALNDELWACIYTTSTIAGTIHAAVPDLLAIGAGQSAASDFSGWSAQATTSDGTAASIWLKARVVW